MFSRKSVMWIIMSTNVSPPPTGNRPTSQRLKQELDSKQRKTMMFMFIYWSTVTERCLVHTYSSFCCFHQPVVSVCFNWSEGLRSDNMDNNKVINLSLSFFTLHFTLLHTNFVRPLTKTSLNEKRNIQSHEMLKFDDDFQYCSIVMYQH